MGLFTKRKARDDKDEDVTDAETLALLAKTEDAVRRLEATAERLDELVASLGTYVKREETGA